MPRPYARFVRVTSFSLLFAIPATAQTAIFTPGDSVFGIQVDGGGANVGIVGFTVGVNNWPGAEGPESAIDGVGQKYLNFGEFDTGIIVTPSVGLSTAKSMTLWSANDAEPRDPGLYVLWGTNEPITGAGPFLLADFTQISFGDLALPSTRNAGGNNPLEPQNSFTVEFGANTESFTSYLVYFPTVKDPGAANSMQIAEVQLHGVIVPAPATVMLMGLALVGVRRRRG